ncbi:hypothetical protein WH47_12454 [Habropoda laboriosa]|uniref:Uncharacterized protein n=1 Tax=Habropoda laboriosa TaxID=597456 RepID=A0A0L7R009_9HYME|nr:hypothetical protein WH47_12454 [Habropoda laboriosa]
MPKLNKFLVTSIIGDIRECVCVSNEIYSWLGDIEHLSWKFPTKTAKDVNAMEIVKEHNGTAGEFYILLLELAYDRIQFVLRLIVEFMDKYPFVEDFFKEATCVSRSNQISLASLLRLVWDRLKTLPDSISRHMKFPYYSIGGSSRKIAARQQVKNSNGEASEVFFVDRVSQSSQAGSSMSYCESCTLAGEAVIQAINAIERVFPENKLISMAVAERDECKNAIYERTQWSVMSRLTKGIGRDVETALRMVEESNSKAETAKRDRDRETRELQANLTTQEKRADALAVENLELKELLENGRCIAVSDEANRCIALIRLKPREDVEGVKRGNAAVREENETLRETLEDTRRQMSMLAGENNILQSQAVTLAESKLELEETVIRLRKEIVDTRDAYLETERCTRTLLDESRKENDSLRGKHKQRIDQLEEEIESLRLLISNKKENEGSKSADDNGSIKGIRGGRILKPEDDPVADMTRQLISNREKIELLSRQNERLSKTLCRLREHRLTGQTSTNGSNRMAH